METRRRLRRRVLSILMVLFLVAGMLPGIVVPAEGASKKDSTEGLVSLTVAHVGCITTKVDPLPEDITIDDCGFPVFWYKKGTYIKHFENNIPNIYGNTLMRVAVIENDGGIIKLNVNHPWSWKNFYR